MSILSFLFVILNFSTSTPAVDITCNQLIEAISDYDKGSITYCNRYKIPVVDSNGKMMFDLGLQQRGSVTRLSMNPAMECRIVSGASVTITFTDEVECVVVSNPKSISGKIDIEIDAELRSKMMTDKVLSIAFDGMKYPYNVILKPNQGRLVQDLMNCLQN